MHAVLVIYYKYCKHHNRLRKPVTLEGTMMVAHASLAKKGNSKRATRSCAEIMQKHIASVADLVSSLVERP